MSSLKKHINSLKANIKKYTKTYLIVCISLLVSTNIYYNYNTAKKELKEQEKNYVLKDSEGLYLIKGEALNNITNFIVMSPKSSTSKTILIKDKTQKKIAIYEDVPIEAFYLYNKTVLEPYVGTAKNFNFQYTRTLNGVHKSLGVPSDPKQVKGATSESSSGIWGTIINILFLGLLFWAFVHFNGRNLSTSADKVDPSDIKDDLDDLVGMEDIKKELLQIEDMVLKQRLYSKYNVNKKFNVMMTGPAGVGKTKLARCLAKRLNAPLIYSSAANLQSGYVGGGPRALKLLLKKASRYDRAIIFIDEAESLFMNRVQNGIRDYERDTINALLALLDGVNTTDSEVIWVVASNMDENKVHMDEAMLRRFQLKINFRLPNFEERKEILSRLVGKISKEKLADGLDLSKIASISAGMSPAILETLVDRASLIAIQEHSHLTQEIMMRAFERVAVGLTDRETTANMEEKRKLIARHEAGHFVMQVYEALIKTKGDLTNIHNHINVIKISTESVSKMGALGFVLSKEQELKLQTLDDYENQLKQLYGGMVNEELFYGGGGVTAGAQNDIQKVSELLKVMVGEVGYYQGPKLNYGVLNTNNQITEKQLAVIEEVSMRLYNETKEFLSDNLQLSESIASKLMDEYVLDIEDALEIVVGFYGRNPELIVKYFESDLKGQAA